MADDDQARCLEICTDSPAGVAAAIAGGADRIELCSALDVGGLTPSAGLVVAARTATRAAGVALYAMVRPRSGDFTYDDLELGLAIQEARSLIAHGVDGLVFGAVRGGRVDTAVAGAWIAAVCDAAGLRLPCTFHRAVDVLDDPVGAIDDVAALGFNRILTSGGATRASDGAGTIRAMVLQAHATPVAIMAGAGVTPANVAALIAATGVRDVHASAGVTRGRPGARLVELGFAQSPRRYTDEVTVRALRSVLDNKTEIRH